MDTKENFIFGVNAYASQVAPLNRRATELATKFDLLMYFMLFEAEIGYHVHCGIRGLPGAILDFQTEFGLL